MTGQANQKIEFIRTSAVSGLTANEIATSIGVCAAYVKLLAKQNGIEIPRPAKRLAKAQELKALAKKGFTRKQAAQRLKLSYSSIQKYSDQYGIKFAKAHHLAPAVRLAHATRAIEFANLYRYGQTLEQIGQKFKVTRERVRQVLAKEFGISALDGGQHTRTIENQKKISARRDKHSLKKWGCSWGQYVELRAMMTPTRAYAGQKRNTHSRGLGWELTLWQWWKIWEQSGHWSERGRGKNKYCMCRLNDTGPYAVDNVYIATQRENMQDYWAKEKQNPSRQYCRAIFTPAEAKERAKVQARLYRARKKAGLVQSREVAA